MWTGASGLGIVYTTYEFALTVAGQKIQLIDELRGPYYDGRANVR